MGEIHWVPLDVLVPPSKPPWSMVAIRNQRDNGCKNPFPPINHENLHIPTTDPTPSIANQISHIHAQLSFSDSVWDSDSDSNSSSTFSPSDPSQSPSSPLFLDPRLVDTARRFDTWTEVLYAKVSGLARLFFRSFNSSGRVLLTFRSAAFTAVLIAFLYFRRRRRSKAGVESGERLIDIINERDEKINQLLDQISQMNQVLLTLRRIPTP